MRAHQPGWTYRLMARDNGALADFNLAIGLWPDADETVAEQSKPSKNTVPNWRHNFKQNRRQSKHRSASKTSRPAGHLATARLLTVAPSRLDIQIGIASVRA